jgi:hypothetical protein
VSLVNIDTPVFHVGRGTLHAQRDAYRDRPTDAPWGDIRWNSTVLYMNGPEWGLGDAPERRLDGRVTYLDFDWGAVAPMVQLKRIVAPAAPAAGAHGAGLS